MPLTLDVDPSPESSKSLVHKWNQLFSIDDRSSLLQILCEEEQNSKKLYLLKL